jgi:predicted MFS family arabinose efflux permease
MTATTIDTSSYSRVERISIIASCMLGFALDLYDVLIMPFLMGSIQKSLQISLAQVASVTSLTLIGSVIGGALFGWLGDRVGRKQSLQLTLLMFAAGSIASAFAWNYWSLAILRLVTGIGLGGEWGAGMVLFNEAWNKDRRGLGSAFIQKRRDRKRRRVGHRRLGHDIVQSRMGLENRAADRRLTNSPDDFHPPVHARVKGVAAV